jgi:mannosyltransferase
VAALPALYYFGRQVTGRQEAFLAALFMALNYQYVWYSQNARGYTGLLFGVLFASILFIRLLATTRPPTRLIVGYAIVAALTTWIQLTAVFIVLVHGLVWLALASKPNRAERFAAAFPAFLALFLTGILTLALYAPLLGTGQGQVGAAISAGSAAATEQVSGGAINVALMKWNLQEYAQGVQRSIPGGWPVVVIVVFVLFTGIGSYLRQGVSIAALLILPTLLTFLLIYWRTRYFFPRFLFGASGFLLLLGVRGGFVAARSFLPFLSRRQVLFIGCLMALAGTALVPAAWQPKQDFVATAQFIEQHRAPGDGVICLSQTIAALKKFMGMDCEPARSLAELIQIEAHYERAWLIYTLPRSMRHFAPGVLQWIQQAPDYVKVKVFPGTLNDGEIIVLLKKPTRQADTPGPDGSQ